jgi:hypothetical protein
LLCVLLLHGGWSVKQYLVYGTLTPNTSTWGGVSSVVGLIRAGVGQPFLDTMLQEEERYPSWFTRMVRDHGLVHWHPPLYQTYVPPAVQAHDAAIQARLQQTNPTENSVGLRVISDLYMRAYGRLLVHQPMLVAEKFVRSYLVFWQPIRNYSAQFVAPLYVDPLVQNSFRADQLWAALTVDGGQEAHYTMQGTLDAKIGQPTRFYTLPYVPLLMLGLNIIVMHVVVPLLVLNDARQRLVLRKRILPPEFYFLVGCYLYAAVVMNIAEHGENMRFRLSVEPVIWIMSIYAMTLFARLVRSSLRRSMEPSAAATPPSP